LIGGVTRHQDRAGPTLSATAFIRTIPLPPPAPLGRRLLEYAFDHAVATGRKKVTIVHKANIMKALTG
jgi:Isocitrate/isopropylmalate dehydrogenase